MCGQPRFTARWPEGSQTFGRWLFDPGGVTAISRWLRAATPPGGGKRISTHPGGVPEGYGCDPSGVEHAWGDGIRWYRCAQPPANLCDHSGVEHAWADTPYANVPEVGGEPHVVMRS